MKLKTNLEENSRAFQCCFCCHVRTGTLILGIFHLLAYILALGFLLAAYTHPELYEQLAVKKEAGSSMDTDGIKIVTTVNQDSQQEGQDLVLYKDQQEDALPEPATYFKQQRTEDKCLAVAVLVCGLVIVLLLLYGTIKSRPGYLMPFFCVQVFNFCISCFSILVYYTYTPNVKIWILRNGLEKCPVFERMLQMDEQSLMLFCFLVLILVLSIKAYLIGMIWSCYKYLQLRNAKRSVVREYTVDPDNEMLLPPKYEDAVRSAADQPAPPPYTA